MMSGGRDKIHEKDIAELRRKTDVPAISFASVRNGEISQEIAQGKTDISASSDDVTTNTVFEAASLSKIVFAYLVLKLAQDGILDLEKPLVDIFPHERLIGHENWQKVAALNVLSHQSGLPGMDFGSDREFTFQFKPNEGYGYSGVAYFYLQKVIEHLTGMSLETLAKKYVFEPLQMNHSSFLRLKDFQIANGHTVQNESIRKSEGLSIIAGCDLVSISTSPNKSTLDTLPIQSNSAYIRSSDRLFYVDKTNKICSELSISKATLESFDKELSPANEARTLSENELQKITSMTGHTQSNFSAVAPMTLHTTAHDYALFISAWMNDKTLLHAFKPTVYMTEDEWARDQQVSEDDLKKLAWGLGWGLQITDQGTIAFHWGDVGESKAFVAVNVDKQTGIVYFTNSHNGLSIAQDVASQTLGVDLNPLFNYLFKKYGYEHHDTPDWKKKQAMGTWHIFAEHELHDKAKWIADSQKNKQLFIDNDMDECTITITYNPAQLTLLAKIIRNEFNYFKYQNQMKDTDCIFIESNGRNNLMSLSINIPNRELYNKFIQMLSSENLIPATEISLQNKSHSHASFFRPSSTQQLINENKLMPASASWWDQELIEKREMLEAFWWERIIKLNQKSIDEFKKHIINTHFPKSSVWNEKIEKLFSDAVARKIDFDQFFDELKYLPMIHVRGMANFEKIPLPHAGETIEPKPEIETSDLINIKRYMVERGMTGSVSFGFADQGIITPDYSEGSKCSYAMHSVGKVFTGMLTLVMIRDGVLTEKELNEPLGKDFIESLALPESIKKHLSENQVTLHQLMTHKAGLSDYLGDYGKAISQGKIPEMNKAEDFLQFAETSTSPVGKEKYSNLGILLVGLAVKHAYEKKHGACEYNELLSKYIIDQVGMPSFSSKKPEQNAKYNPEDSIAPHIAGSPAGGYWVTAEDLAKFGQWIYKSCNDDPNLLVLIKKYGQEFYNEEYNIISHGGAISSSSAFLSVSLNTGAVIATLSDQPDMAFELNSMMQTHVFAKRPEAVEEEIEISYKKEF
jgi:CubicO group peptidase (beta-lactamase class C family)